MTDRLFDLDGIPEVPLLREPPPGRGALIMDERISHDYPPDWHECQTCQGDGFGAPSAEFLVERGHASIACSPGQGGNWAQVTHKPTGRTGFSDSSDSGLRNVELALATVRQQLRTDGIVCPDCLGMGSAKAMVRLLAGHRCERCHHPYVPKGDAKMLGVEPTPYRWSPCDGRCLHIAPSGGPVRIRPLDGSSEPDLVGSDGESYKAGFVREAFLPEFIAVEAEWRILTVHHLDGDKANLAWWNLAALCQICHLTVQGRVVLERVYPHPHSEWFRPHVAGYYASVYLGEQLTREQVESRMDELLALELDPSYG